MPVDTKEILDSADKLGQLVAQHPAVEKYRQAQRSLSEDPDAGRLMNEFNRQLMTLSRQEQSGMPVSDAQRHGLENLQQQLAAHIKVKALNMAQVEFYDLLRKVSETIRSHVEGEPAGGGESSGGGGRPAPAAGGPKLVI
jgi:cell fate (sporulation/competence/biofilm development) regulator YlbF (YheA/YmcA/DUF963 family)